MPAVTRSWPKRLLLSAAAVATLLVVHLNLLPIAGHRLLGAWLDGPAEDGRLGLDRYTVAAEAIPIEGLQGNVSGLTFNQASGTLFTVINRPAEVAELTPDGRLLRRLALPGLADPEGITHVEGDLFIVADESDSRLHLLRIAPGAPAVARLSTVRLDLGPFRNLGFEGISWNESDAELFVVNEKWPRRVLTVRGFPLPGAGGAAPLDVAPWTGPGGWGLLGSDLSSVSIHRRSGHVLLLSEESAVLAEYTRSGDIRGLLPLWAGWHGLRRKVPQPEGVALGPDDTIYLVSEPNLLYRYVRRPR